MEAKCDYCKFFGEKEHCHNCKVINKANRQAREIDCTLEELVEYINGNADISERFLIGDYITIELCNGEQVKMYLIDTNKDDLADGSGKAHSTFGIMHIDEAYQMNATDTNVGGYAQCKMRTTYLPHVFKMLPAILQNNIKTVTKKTSQGNQLDNIIDTEEQLFLFSDVEVTGRASYSYEGEGSQYEFFDNALNRSLCGYSHSRSPYRLNSRYYIYFSNGASDYYCASNFHRLSFGFCI